MPVQAGRGTIAAMVSSRWPLAGLRLQTLELELRWPSLDDLDALAGLAAAGVHDPVRAARRELTSPGQQTPDRPDGRPRLAMPCPRPAVGGAGSGLWLR